MNCIVVSVHSFGQHVHACVVVHTTKHAVVGQDLRGSLSGQYIPDLENMIDS